MIKNFGQLSLNLMETHPLYEAVVDPDNKWRKFKEQIDFSFVNPLLADQYCIDYGRPTDPELMFKLLFIKMMDNLSDQKLVDEAKVNMAYKYFLGLHPEDSICHSSLLSKFRKLRLQDEEVLEGLLTEVVNQAVDKGLIKSKTLIIDATHTQSQHQAQTPIEMLRELSKKIRRKLYLHFPQLKEQVPPKLHSTASLEEEVAYTQELIAFAQKHLDDQGQVEKEVERAQKLLEEDRYHSVSSVHDPEAKVGYKSQEESFNGYKNHIAITDERMMVGLEVTTGEVSDGHYLPALVEQAHD